MHVSGIDVHFRIDTGFLQVLHVSERFGIERFAIGHKGIAGGKIRVIRLAGGGRRTCSPDRFRTGPPGSAPSPNGSSSYSSPRALLGKDDKEQDHQHFHRCFFLFE